MSQPYKITSRFLSLNGELVLKAMISLTKSSHTNRWIYTSEDDGQIVLIDTDKEEGRRMWMDLSGTGEGQVLIAYTSRADRYPDNSLVLQKPMRSNELIPLLERVTNQLSTNSGEQQVNNVIQEIITPAEPSIATTESSSEPAPEPSVSVTTSSGERALDILLQHPDKPLRVVNGSRSLILERSRYQYFSATPDVDVTSILLSDSSKLRIEPIELDQLAAQTRGLISQELTPPLWNAVLNGSNGKLLPGLSENNTYRLLRWPDFKQLDHKPTHIKLTVFLSKRGGDIRTLARQSGMPIEKIIDFINACHALQYLEIRQGIIPTTETPPAKEVSKAKLGLFARIRARLGI